MSVRDNAGASFRAACCDTFLATLPERLAANTEGVWWLRGQAMLKSVSENEKLKYEEDEVEAGASTSSGERTSSFLDKAGTFYLHEQLDAVLQRASVIIEAGFGVSEDGEVGSGCGANEDRDDNGEGESDGDGTGHGAD